MINRETDITEGCRPLGIVFGLILLATLTVSAALSFVGVYLAFKALMLCF